MTTLNTSDSLLGTFAEVENWADAEQLWEISYEELQAHYTQLLDDINAVEDRLRQPPAEATDDAIQQNIALWDQLRQWRQVYDEILESHRRNTEEPAEEESHPCRCCGADLSERDADPYCYDCVVDMDEEYKSKMMRHGKRCDSCCKQFHPNERTGYIECACNEL